MLKAIALDFDGVILESVDIKTRAFRELFKDHPKHLERIVRLHLENGGLSRYEKFDAIYKEVLRRPLSDLERDRLGREFETFVVREIMQCPFVRGAREFLDAVSTKYPLFVVSGTPEIELRRIIAGRALSPYFRQVYGSPRSKSEILRSVLAETQGHPEEVLFVGDSRTDYEAAKEVGVIFIGRVQSGAPNPFPFPSVRFVEDFAELGSVLD